ncbi:hypothetical protein CEXT_632721 [Caerostris extrusa]|uniref:Uncharacterized protein n=1 Tax=Caerostris extrusa TaxID=172846 RepID=A0AAV4MG10_CAEEX|nr:hypothetical protein CEXT_632721 [Caerostris extrusa]
MGEQECGPLILSSGNWREKKKSRETAKRKFGREVSEMYCSSVIDGCWVWVYVLHLRGAVVSICVRYPSQSHFPRPFCPEEVLQDQRGNSGDFSVLGLAMVQPLLVPAGKSSDEWENRNAAP